VNDILLAGARLGDQRLQQGVGSFARQQVFLLVFPHGAADAARTELKIDFLFVTGRGLAHAQAAPNRSLTLTRGRARRKYRVLRGVQHGRSKRGLRLATAGTCSEARQDGELNIPK